MSHSSSSTSLPVHTNNSGFLAVAIFIFFFFLCSVSLSTVCLFTAYSLCACSIFSSPFLVNIKCYPETWNMNYSVFGRFQWIRVDANILKTITRKMEKKKIVFACVDGPYDILAQQMSTFSGRLLSPRCTTERHRKSFLPVVIKLYNASLRE